MRQLRDRFRLSVRRVVSALGLVAAAGVALAPTATQNAIANGDTRSLSLYHQHTGEAATITFKVNGSYDSSALEKLNWITRDWRRDEPIRMNPRVFDLVWEVHRMSGSRSPIKIMSAYRSPQTNAMLRRRSGAVAKHSQHMQGNAMDVHFPDVGASRAREMGVRLQRGGVGYYPSANSPFVHLDVGSVRHWPRMSYDQLARIFPDGKTVHIPSNGQPLPGYDAALAEIERNGGTAFASAYVTSQKSKGLLAFLFGGGEDEEEEVAVAPRGRGKRGQAIAQRGRGDGRFEVAAVSSAGGDDAGSKTFFVGGARQAPVADNPSPAVQRAMRNLPRGEAVMRPAEPEKKPEIKPVEAKPAETTVAEPARPVAAPTPPARPTQVASLEPVRPAAEAETATRGARPEAAKNEPKVADVPTPPRRPSSMMIAELGFANAPLPPSRPVELAALRGAPAEAAKALDRPTRDLIAAKLAAVDRAALPGVITQGSATRSVHAALAYAGETAPAPVPRPKEAALSRPDLARAPAPDFVAARVDRSNFRALTASAPSTRTTTQSTLGPTVAPVRQAARANVGALMLRSSVDVVSTFGDRPTGDLIPSRFTGPAVQSIPQPNMFGALPAAAPAE
ncbi:MAG: DUF882 domain-containing protein [Methylobacteriaceae bacterium]|nr:DUF882 domain-containing protein [Methylobacteriaceae bacterium]